MKEEIKLQWLPDPCRGGGGWNDPKPSFFNDNNASNLSGFNRFGEMLASVEYRDHYYLPGEWLVVIYSKNNHYSAEKLSAKTSREAILLAEKILTEMGQD